MIFNMIIQLIIPDTTQYVELNTELLFFFNQFG